MATDQVERTQTLVDAPPVQQGPEGEGRPGSGVGRLEDLRVRLLSKRRPTQGNTAVVGLIGEPPW